MRRKDVMKEFLDGFPVPDAPFYRIRQEYIDALGWDVAGGAAASWIVKDIKGAAAADQVMATMQQQEKARVAKVRKQGGRTGGLTRDEVQRGRHTKPKPQKRVYTPASPAAAAARKEEDEDFCPNCDL